MVIMMVTAMVVIMMVDANVIPHSIIPNRFCSCRCFRSAPRNNNDNTTHNWNNNHPLIQYIQLLVMIPAPIPAACK